ncbi:MAG: type II secretion system protein [Limisphaerales bacterium]
MKTAIKKHLPGWPSRTARCFNTVKAFTLVELLVVIATLAVLSVIFLPALAGSRAQPKVTACAANFRQWAVSVNLYANDHLDWLPRFDWGGGGGNYLWDVSTNSVVALGPYGLTVPMWFCPVRDNEFENTEKSFEQKYGRIISGLEDLTASFNINPYTESIINHNWWVQRSQAIPAFSANLYPPDRYSNPAFLSQFIWMKGTPWGDDGAPSMPSKKAWNNVPFISDKAGSSTAGKGFDPPLSGIASRNAKDCSPNTAHFYNRVLKGVNAAYADGHVETHNRLQMLCGYDQGETIFWYY